MNGYTSSEVCRLAGTSYRQLDYWTRTGLVSPSIYPGHGSGHHRLWSAEDLMHVAAISRYISAGFTLAAAANRARAEQRVSA